MRQPKYHLAKNGEFVIENYQSAPPFSSFFPGIAGLFGRPMWVFYANRGQCITSAGVTNKNNAIIEFRPANKSYRLASLHGFRTFIKIDGNYYEPFAESSPTEKQLFISPESIRLVDENPKLKLRVEVTYFTIPNDTFPALARVVNVTNLSKQRRKVELTDGLPIIIPFGFDNDLLKKISQTIEAWCTVENLKAGAPFFKLKVLPADISETKLIEKGHFYLSFFNQKGKESPADLIIQPRAIFGQVTSFEIPEAFTSTASFKAPKDQPTDGFTPCAFSYKKFSLAGRETAMLASLIGQSEGLDDLKEIKKAFNKDYLAGKYVENRDLIRGVTSFMQTNSSQPAFDHYSGYTFLDNVMRGGLPVTLGGKTPYLYYRKHGDMERDYNDFLLLPIYFSQGNGNYRDINQNRRHDLFFNPEVKADNIKRFFNLVQLDGYNPLVVLGSRYCLKNQDEALALLEKHLQNYPALLVGELAKPFVLGNVLTALDKGGAVYKISRQEFARDLLAAAEAQEDAIHGEGFWADHFSYNTDLLESFQSIYPELFSFLLVKEKSFTFFDNDHVVLPRKQKYKLSGKAVRQYDSVARDEEKTSLIGARSLQKNLVRTSFGKGEPYKTTLLSKIICLVVNKAASFDAEGIGLEMEAEKPDWYDALNGLPGLLGSSLSQTLELKRLCQFTANNLSGDEEVLLPVEVRDLAEMLNRELVDALDRLDSFKYWENSCQLKEDFRARTKFGISGSEAPLRGKDVLGLLSNIIKKCDWGIKKCLQKYRTYVTYFINEVVDHELAPTGEIRVRAFAQHPLPLFLEGFVHALKVEKDRRIPQQVKEGPLYDKKLKMFRVNAPLKDCPLEIGRASVFPPGWLENGSIWLHMEYKYLLELLKAGMYKEFFADIKTMLVPFLDPAVYKRSILENSSFLVSSVNQDRENHGRGFVARLSGGAAEFIEMWLIMMTGKKIFFLDEQGKLNFRLSPVLPAWLFNKGKLSFKLLGTIDVTYLNENKRDTYGHGVSPVSYKLIFDDREEIEVHDPIIKEPYASAIRERLVRSMVVTLK